MSCDRHRTAVIDVALGEPGPEGFEAHLLDCRDCRAALEQETQRASALDGQLRAALDADPSPWFQTRVRQRVVDQARGGQRGGRAWKWAAPALAALGLALVVFPLLRRARPAHGFVSPARAGSLGRSLAASLRVRKDHEGGSRLDPP
jgi:hypothetical protein